MVYHPSAAHDITSKPQRTEVVQDMNNWILLTIWEDESMVSEEAEDGLKRQSHTIYLPQAFKIISSKSDKFLSH